MRLKPAPVDVGIGRQKTTSVIKSTLGKVGFWRRWRAKKGNVNKELLIAQVMSKHVTWFPAHNRGREAPQEALAAWRRQLQSLAENELILLIADNRARNRLLGKTWPSLTEV